MPALLNWVLKGTTKSLGNAGKEIVTGTPSALGAIGTAVKYAGHGIGNIVAIPLIPVRGVAKLIEILPKTSAVIGVGAAGFTAHEMLKAKPQSADFSPALAANDDALAQTHVAQQQMQMAAATLPQPAYAMPPSLMEVAPSNQIPMPVSSAELQGMLAQMQAQGRGASA